MQTTVLTISTSVARGDSEDISGRLLAELATAAGAEIVASEVLADDRDQIEERLRHHVASGVTFIFTTGGTGLTPDDVTPEATRAVIDREAPGYAETMRAQSLSHTPLGILTRGVSGVAERTLIINFPGNPKAISQLFPIVAATLSHAAAQLRREGGRPAP
ncbi:MAG: MogA/MoaB family molybdenum cofactor biosynthesis protein [Actinomycetota bacterium]